MRSHRSVGVLSSAVLVLAAALGGRTATGTEHDLGGSIVDNAEAGGVARARLLAFLAGLG